MHRKFDLSGLTTIGIDAGKNSLHLIGLDAKGAIVPREKERCKQRAKGVRIFSK
jgi:transposase